MFVQHNELKKLQVPAEKITHLHSASSSIQLSFSGYSPQLCQAYLLQITGGNKVLIIVAFYLAESCCSIFFVPESGELPLADAEKVYEEGYCFIESMGFFLNETDYHLLSAKKKKTYWSTLPICQSTQELPQVKPVKPVVKSTEEPAEKSVEKPLVDNDIDSLRISSRKSLGRFFAAM
ncbi:MAG: hypothetical protein KAU22_04265 [Desulfuromonadales bacterium]|nr:hypothetical protein [Desulfuromonadales bacterium]